ncbi:unnamed protein product [marine sediment metagenome]|uniref:Uncharacterized protein n=1 Tax=marine sediment metagenome TaxID=412755 RepID=X0U484_9ZZZZ
MQLLGEYYGCPTGVHGGKTDSCFHDEQTGVEKAASMLMGVLAGAVGIGTIGHLENAVTFSPAQLVIDNEIAGFVRRCVREPIEVSEETLATALVDSVGPGGNFLTSPHTAEHFRDELFLSPLFGARGWEDARGRPEEFETSAKAEAMARELWKPPEAPVLSDGQIAEIDAIVGRATGG